MAKEQIYTIKIDAEVNALQKKFSDVKTKLEQMGALGKFPDLDKSLGNLGKRLDKIKETAAQPASGAAFRSLNKDILASGVQLDGLLDIFKDLVKNIDGTALELLPKDQVQRIQGAVAALNAYDKAIEQSTQKTKEHIAADKELEKQQAKKSAVEGKKSDFTASLGQAKSQREEAEKALNLTKQQIAEKEKLIAAQEEYLDKLEKEYETSKTPKNRKININGKETSLQKERNKLKKSKEDLGGLQAKEAENREAFNVASKAVKTYTTEINKCNTELEVIENAITRCTKAVADFNEAMNGSTIKQQEDAYKALRTEAAKLGVDVSDIPLDSTEENVAELTNRIKVLKDQALEPARKKMREVAADAETLGESLEQASDATNDSKEGFEQFTEAAQRSEAFKQKAKEFIGMAGAAKVLRAALRNAYQDIKELDAAMAEIAVVTDFSVGDMWEQLPEYTARANELGVAIKSVYEASALYYQQGLDTNEVAELSTETLKMMKIAGLDAKDATDRMTAALRGFNMELNQMSAQNVADVYSELAAITAADVNDISIAMTKTASIAKSAGMEFESTAAILSQIIETTQESPETAGTALKTIIARFQELKKAPDEIGEVDGEIVNANQIEGALRSVGVSLRDAGGQFRELDDVFMELSSKWGGLDKNTQRYIATIAAGSRQQSRFIAMMQDYERTQELVSAANNSAGASNKQYEKTLETLESKLQRLDNAWSEFTTGIINQAWVKGAVDGLTSVMNLINKMTTVDIPGLSDKWNGALTSFSKIGLLIGAFTLAKAAFEKFGTFIDQKFKEYGQTIGKEIADGIKKGLDDGAKHIDNAKNSETDSEKNPESIPTEQLEKYKYDSQGILRDQNGQTVSDEAKTQYEEMKLQKAKEIQTSLGGQQSTPKEKKSRRSITQWANDTLEKGGKKEQVENFNNKVDKKAKKKKLQVSNAKIKVETKALKLKEKSIGLSDKEQEKLDSLIKKEGKQRQEIKKIDKELDEQGKSAKDTGEKTEDANKKMGKSLQNTGIALTAVGAGFGMVSGMLANMGADKAAEAFNFLGSTLTTVGSIMSLVGTVQQFVKAGSLATAKTKIAEAGAWIVATIAAGEFMAVILILTIALVALLAIIIAVVAWMNRPTKAEKNLKAATKASEEAKEAAEKATEAYKNFSTALDELDSKYKALEQLTIGTQEWNEAMLDVNQSVLDLINKYPELASYVKNVDGVLTLDTNSDEVQAMLEKSSTGARVAQSHAAIASAKLSEAQLAVDIEDSELFDHTSYYTIDEHTGQQRSATDEDRINQAKDWALSYAKGDLTEEELKSLANASDEVVEELKRFGNGLIAAEKQMEVAATSIANSAVDSYGEKLSQEERERALGVTQSVASETYSKAETAVESAKIEGKYTTLEGEDYELAQRAIESEYGPGATVTDNGKVTYKDENGDPVTEQLSEDKLQSIMATQKAYEDQKAKVEAADDAYLAMSNRLGDEALANNIMTGNLTKSDLEKLGEEDLKLLYGSMGKAGETIYGSAEEFSQKMIELQEKSEKEYAKSDEINANIGVGGADFWKKLSSGAAEGLSENLKEVYEKTGVEGAQALEAQFSVLGDQLSPEKLEKVVALYNGIDIGNQRALLDAQYQLTQEYGVSREAAETLTQVFMTQNKVADDLVLAIPTINEFTNAMSKVENAVKKATDAAWEYEQAMRSGDTSKIESSIDAQIKAYQDQAKEAEIAASGALSNLTKNYASGATQAVGYDFRDYLTVDGKEVTQTQEQMDAYNKLPPEIQKQFDEWKEGIDSSQQDVDSAEEAAKTALTGLQELEDTLKQSYDDLRERAVEAVSTQLQKQIDLQQEQLDVERNGFTNLINKVQEQINDQREARAQQEAKESLNDAYNQLSLMQMDTAGGNQLGVAQLEKDIEQQEQDYQDTLVDQTLQELQDANEKAFDQREEQISLQKDALDAYLDSSAFQEHIDAQMTELMNLGTESTLAKTIQTVEQKGMSAAQKELWTEKFKGQVTAAQEYATEFENKGENGSDNPYTAINNSISSLGDKIDKIDISSLSDDLATQNLKTELSGKGFSEASMKDKDLKSLRKMQEFANAEGDSSSISSEQNRLNGIGVSYDTKQQYYSKHADEIARGEKVESYETYLKNREQNYNNEQIGPTQTGTITAGYDPISGTKAGEQVSVAYQKVTGTPAVKNEDGTGNYKEAKAVIKSESDDDGWVLWNEKDANSTSDTEVGAQKIGTKWYQFETDGTDVGGYLPDGAKSGAETEDIVGFKMPDGETWAAVYTGKKWVKMTDNYDGKTIKSLFQFESGGLADFTGPAWLDGTKSRPEYVLNSDQTERFFSLIDVLEGFDKNPTTTEKSGDSYIDVDINVESIASDYDVEQLANKIRSMIYDDATYRNVNNVSHIR